MSKVVIVLPAYNAHKTLQKTLNDIPRKYKKNVLLVDDQSNDHTFQLAKKLGIRAYQLKQNTGYGGNQKKCYAVALKHGADIVVMLHPDYQYDPKLIPHFVELIEQGYFDVMLGSRIRSRKEALQSGMPLYKYLANRTLSFLQNIATGQNLSEWHTGMRAYKREVLEGIDFQNNSDDFVFDTEVLLQIVKGGFTIGEISIPARYRQDSSSIDMMNSMKYGIKSLYLSIKYMLYQ